MSQPSYFAEKHAGKKEAYRLQLQHEIFGPGTRKFLKTFVQHGNHVLIAGVGTGEEAIDIAQLVGNSGFVLGIDTNEKQLQQAQTKLAQHNIHHVHFKQMDLMELSQLDQTFDIAFTRMVLVHMPDPLAAMHSILTCVRPEGKLACEETVMKDAFAEPPHPALDKHIDLLMELSKHAKLNFSLGKELRNLFKQAHLQNIQQSINQPVMSCKEHKAISPLSAEACKDAYFKFGLISEDEFNQLIKSLWEHVVNDPNRTVTQVRNYQVVGTKPI